MPEGDADGSDTAHADGADHAGLHTPQCPTHSPQTAQVANTHVPLMHPTPPHARCTTDGVRTITCVMNQRTKIEVTQLGQLGQGRGKMLHASSPMLLPPDKAEMRDTGAGHAGDVEMKWV